MKLALCMLAVVGILAIPPIVDAFREVHKDGVL